MGKSSELNFIKENKWRKNDIIELKNGKFADVENGCFFGENHSLLIKNGKIISMNSQSKGMRAVEADYSIDLKGKTVLPGFFNVHCHVQMINPTLFTDFKTSRARKKYHDKQVDKNMEECLSRGITNIRDAYSEDLRPNRRLAVRIKSGEIAGPRIQQAIVVGALGGYLSPNLKGLNKKIVGLLGQGKIDFDDKISGVVVFPEDANEQRVRDAVDRAIEERGADLIKVGESLEESIINSNPSLMSAGQMAAICEQAGRRGLQSTIHSVSVGTFRRAVSAGFSTLAHVPRDGKLLQKDIEDCKIQGCIIDPTLSVGYDMSWRIKGDPFYNDPILEKLYEYKYKVFDSLVDEFWIPELQKFVRRGFKKANRSEYKMFGVVNMEKLLGHFSGLPATGSENARMLLENGVSMACGNDGGIQSCTPAMIGNELSLLDLLLNVNSGEKIFDGKLAVKTATINSARSMGLDDKFGSLQVGKIADLVITEGDPFEDISIIGKKVEGLIMDGKLIIDNCGLGI